MTREEAIHKMEYSKRAYQMLIDEKVQEGVLVGQGINAEWSADTPIIDAYKDMLDACELAIKALEQEPKTDGDCISRQAAVNIASGFCHPANVADELAKLPSVNPQTHWIPVSERMPEENYYCLCCDKDGYMTIGSILKWSKDWVFEDDEIYIDVAAWMPLPEPYTAESEGAG